MGCRNAYFFMLFYFRRGYVFRRVVNVEVHGCVWLAPQANPRQSKALQTVQLPHFLSSGTVSRILPYFGLALGITHRLPSGLIWYIHPMYSSTVNHGGGD